MDNEKKMCDIAHGQACSKNQQNCDSVAKLKCRIVLKPKLNEMHQPIFEQTCSCPDLSSVYEQDRRKCSTPLGLGCT